MFLEKLIEGDMDLEMFQNILHRDHPEDKQLWIFTTSGQRRQRAN